jgi:transporter family protein
MTATSGWFHWALLSAVFAALTAIFAKIGIALKAQISYSPPG